MGLPSSTLSDENRPRRHPTARGQDHPQYVPHADDPRHEGMLRVLHGSGDKGVVQGTVARSLKWPVTSSATSAGILGNSAASNAQMQMGGFDS